VSEPAGRGELRVVPPGTAAADLDATPVARFRALADRATAADVDRALASARPGPGGGGAPRSGAGGASLAELAALLSPVAGRRLEELAQAAHDLTVRRFGRTVRLYAPLYLSNECVSSCAYCGFARGNPVVRRTLSIAEATAEARTLTARGLRHLLLVAGEHSRAVSRDRLVELCHALAPEVPQLSVETQVWDGDTYHRLVRAGCDGVLVYQETYNRSVYTSVHLAGRKRHYAWRLAALDRAAAAGMRRLGLGILLGLHPDWRSDALALAAHARALIRRWWRCEVAVSLPRLRPAAGGFTPRRPVSDRELTQLVCALRLALPDVGIALSTREPPALRDGLVRLGVTAMSAGSRTEPGGYAAGGGAPSAEPQFAVSDHRSPEQVAAALSAAGYDPVWKDWQRI
jgi:2-iminoacetate synthase